MHLSGKVDVSAAKESLVLGDVLVTCDSWSNIIYASIQHKQK